jgi:hypothetical protein
VSSLNLSIFRPFPFGGWPILSHSSTGCETDTTSAARLLSPQARTRLPRCCVVTGGPSAGPPASSRWAARAAAPQGRGWRRLRSRPLEGRGPQPSGGLSPDLPPMRDTARSVRLLPREACAFERSQEAARSARPPGRPTDRPDGIRRASRRGRRSAQRRRACWPRRGSPRRASTTGRSPGRRTARTESPPSAACPRRRTCVSRPLRALRRS